ncbi:MAG: tRNA (adenosine(37)-N6)-threonylcarbamoyltransferase complex dimerization subunit type 1 TsaB [Peptoniphilaceae bacterium]|nr:tRNA (adenosine(37)-N6)-threonylcarbamoyltransferase complex dimerization subunit type 1 TsaB [Peptoniphilaceae bacterium]MDD7383197.1 tRNA (adenosine(37)-N6)-threonylcarbamoyltransferase complex dimerization subunit type 1 TsaB [Peptoniphilaceae bacterium]MDY3738421.1 tRNA (adenosine(37)-N6)-threonylcarbamoyltransferase complex dimerization subunit type 1 TsaB [Peptoniphilaceae bacterium]
MKILAIDTSSMISTVTISEDKKIIGDFNVNQKKTHSESLVPMIETLLSLLGMSINDIDIFAIAKGPGSFTGLRIGMTIAKTLAQVENKKIIPISTLFALSRNIYSDKIVVPLMDARGNRVYAAAFLGYEKKNIVKEDLYNINDFAETINKIDGEKILVGEISSEYLNLFKNAKLAGMSFDNCIGKSLVEIANERKDEENEIFSISPNYLRKSQAQRDLENKKSV